MKMRRPKFEDFKFPRCETELDRYVEYAYSLEEYCNELQEQYKWHDFRKDPNDLPKENGLYMVKVDEKIDPYRAPYRVFKYEPSIYGNPVQNLWKMENNDYCYNDFVIAWKHIEKFK